MVHIPGGWNGFEYWMAHTPYPGGNDDHEDPNIVSSADGVSWFVPEGLVNPIDDADGQPEYNSDVDLRLHPDNTMYLFWRFYDVNSTGTEEKLYYSTSTDGVTWAPKIQYWVSDAAALRLLSPSMLYEDGRWIMWAVDIVPSPNRVVRLEGGANPESGWTAPATVDMGPMQTGKESWHLSIHKVEDSYVGLLTDITTDSGGLDGDNLFIASQDGLIFTNSGTTVTPRVQVGEHDNLYRATMILDTEGDATGYRVWYSAWQNNSPSIWNIFRTFLTAEVEAEPDPDPVEPARPDVGVASVRQSVTWLGCDLVSGRIIAELPEIQGSVSRVLGTYTSHGLKMPIPIAGPGSFSWQGQSLAHIWEQATVPGQTMIVPVVNDVPAAAFIVLTRKGGTGAELQLGTISLEGYLARRYVGDHTWVGQDEASVIAAGLVADAQTEGIDLIVDAPATGTLRERAYQHTDDGTVYQRLTELMDVQGGPEWTIDVDWKDSTRREIAKVFRMRKRIGTPSANPDAVFTTEGSSQATYEHAESYEDGKGANHFRATGSGEGEDRPESSEIDDILPGWPRWERRFSPSSSIKDVGVLTDHAVANLGRMRDGAKTWEIAARWDAYPRLGLDWRLGDDIGYELTGHRHPFGVTGTARAIGWELDMQAGIVKPILLEVD
ncbi:hypothetical protein [Amycolatopsis palatopharyngis]|uniref:hypothetical protein n=1 Tax=Amycolatopsis palatopharyngis TaxID=187982 RepID=UPI0013BE9329|nr:hypothetical protein [Amycolatopsis palatopharyngis]